MLATGRIAGHQPPVRLRLEYTSLPYQGHYRLAARQTMTSMELPGTTPRYRQLADVNNFY